MSNKFVVIIMKDNIFNRNSYVEGETIQKKIRYYVFPILAEGNSNYEIGLRREELISDHKFYSLGIFTENPISFTTVPASAKRKDNS